MNTPHKRFFWALLFFFGATLLPILVLNLILVSSTLEDRPNTLLASQWQQNSLGTVSPPSVLETGYFKLLRLQDRLPEINTVILGASTSYGITQDMFPQPMRIYNFSKNSVGLGTMIGEAEYLSDQAPNIKWIFIPLDWSVGFLYEQGPPNKVSLLPEKQPPQAEPATWMQMIRDSMSYPRIEGLFRALGKILTSEHKMASFRQVFLQNSSDAYTCPDGTLAKDFDLQSRGNCRGFRFDGSWTYNSMDRVKDPQRLILLALTSHSKYTLNLARTQGIPNPLYLERMAVLAHRLQQRGGNIVFFLPPLLSGMDQEFSKHEPNSFYLARTKTSLFNWAAKENLLLIDAGPSERFGCTPAEFTDEHHADPSCYQKIFSAFWQNNTALIRTLQANRKLNK